MQRAGVEARRQRGEIRSPAAGLRRVDEEFEIFKDAAVYCIHMAGQRKRSFKQCRLRALSATEPVHGELLPALCTAGMRYGRRK